MKKFSKISALALAIIMLCVSLSGCASLETMREQQAFWTNEDDINSVTLSNGETYLRLEEEVADDIYFSGYYYDCVYVTEKDVPVLLSQDYSTELSFDSSKNFLEGVVYRGKIDSADGLGIFASAVYFNPLYSFKDTGNYSSDIYAFYCKEDLYDDIMKQYNEGIEYDHYSYEYSSITYDENYNVESEESRTYNFTKEQTAIVDKILEEVKPESDSDIPYESMHLCGIYKLSENNIFFKNPYEIYTVDDAYYIARYSETLDEYTSYKVPNEYIDEFDKITKEAKDAYDENYYAW